MLNALLNTAWANRSMVATPMAALPVMSVSFCSGRYPWVDGAGWGPVGGGGGKHILGTGTHKFLEPLFLLDAPLLFSCMFSVKVELLYLDCP